MTAIRESVYRTVTRTGCAVAFSAVLAIGLGAPSARAQTSQTYDRDATGNEFLTRSATFNGYSDGFGQGADDLKLGPEFKPQLDMTFVRAATGYTSDMGPFADYQSAFRQAYARGYEDAQSGRERDPAMNIPPAPPEPGYRHEEAGPRTHGLGGNFLGVASAQGYDAGYKKGADDGRLGRSYGYRDNPAYLAATDGYDTSLGDETRYQDVFRQIYARGYSDGFNGRARYTDTTVLPDDRGDQRSAMPPTVSRDDIIRVATVSGYHEGYEHGTSDRKARQPSGYRHIEIYRQATTGYDRSWNLEREYQIAFRRGYASGYKAAYYGRERNRTYEDQYTQYFGYRSGDDGRGLSLDSRP